jgi:hypothetical protein
MSDYIHIWHIDNMGRNAETGRVEKLLWRVTTEHLDSGASHSSYGEMICEGEMVIPYENLTEEIVLGWLDFNKEDIMESNEKVIHRHLFPPQLEGLPW